MYAFWGISRGRYTNWTKCPKMVQSIVVGDSPLKNGLSPSNVDKASKSWYENSATSSSECLKN